MITRMTRMTGMTEVKDAFRELKQLGKTTTANLIYTARLELTNSN